MSEDTRNALDVIAWRLCRERHPCWSIVAEIMKEDIDGQATEFRVQAEAIIYDLKEAGFSIKYTAK